VNKFSYANPASFAEAGALLAEKRFALPVLKAGGLDVLDHMKEGLMEPDLLINIRTLRSGKNALGLVPAAGNAAEHVRIEATATLMELAKSPVIQKRAPVISLACGSAATPQVRNVASAAGNLLQRPRCWYYRNEQFDCLKKGGATCFAAEGENKYHAIFGDGPCHIVHPSNLAVALAVLNGRVTVWNAGKERMVSLDKLYHMPSMGVKSEHTLEAGDIITAIAADASPMSGFYAIKEKQSFDWPLVMAAAALELDGDTIKSARICAGAVAPVPWMLPKVSAALAGVKVTDEAALKNACAAAAEGAKPMTDNGYKVKLLSVAVRRAVLKAAGKLMEDHA